MRLLHTADLHLGRQFEGYALERDHAAILDQIFDALVAHQADVLVIAGDVFDRAVPPESAVRQFNRFIQRVASETTAAIVLIAGNHDSGERIGAMSMLADETRALVRGPLSTDERPLILKDAHGPVAFSALPFGYEFAARDCFENPDIKLPEDVLKAQIAAARPHVPADARWVVVAHAFVTGGSVSECERPLTRAVGGIETVSADVFEGADYVALGHLHRPQQVGAPHIRYAGSPLAFGFDEEGSEKSMALVDLDADGAVSVQLLPFEPVRGVRTLKGVFADLIKGVDNVGDEDFVRFILTDAGRLLDAMKRLRERYPFACTLSYERDAAPQDGDRVHGVSKTALDDPEKIVDAFMAFTRGESLDDDEKKVLADELGGLLPAGLEAAE